MTTAYHENGQTGVPAPRLVDGPYRAAIYLLDRDGICTADKLEATLGELDVAHPNHIGGVFARLRNQRLIEIAGYQPSARPQRRGGVQAVWCPTPLFRHLKSVGQLPEAGEAA